MLVTTQPWSLLAKPYQPVAANTIGIQQTKGFLFEKREFCCFHYDHQIQWSALSQASLIVQGVAVSG